MSNDGRAEARFEEALEAGGGSAAARAQYSIELNIGELVLDGFADVDRWRTGESVGRELAKLFRVHGVPPALAGGLEMARLDGLEFNLAADAQPEAIGEQIARAIYGGLRR